MAVAGESYSVARTPGSAGGGVAPTLQPIPCFALAERGQVVLRAGGRWTGLLLVYVISVVSNYEGMKV